MVIKSLRHPEVESSVSNHHDLTLKDKQIYHYITGAVVKSVLSEGFRHKEKSPKWMTVVSCIHSCFREEGADVSPKPDIQQWTALLDRGALTYVGQRALNFFMLCGSIAKGVQPPSRDNFLKTNIPVCTTDVFVGRSCSRPAEPEDEGSPEESMSKLKAVTKTSPDSTVRNLIKVTSTARRLAMATEDNDESSQKIIEIWPHLSVADWNLTKKYFQRNVDVLLQRLAKLFEIKNEEKDYAESLLLMSKKVNKQSQKLRHIIILVEALGSLESIKSVATESPRLVLTVGTTVSQCFLLLDTKQMELPVPTLQRALTVLIAAYYVFDVEYPDVYSNFLTVLDIECVKKANAVKPTHRTLLKFLRDMSHVYLESELNEDE